MSKEFVQAGACQNGFWGRWRVFCIILEAMGVDVDIVEGFDESDIVSSFEGLADLTSLALF